MINDLKLLCYLIWWDDQGLKHAGCATTCLKCHQSWSDLKLAIVSCQSQILLSYKQWSMPSRSLQLLSWRAYAWWEPEWAMPCHDAMTHIWICHHFNHGSWILESTQKINRNMLQQVSVWGLSSKNRLPVPRVTMFVTTACVLDYMAQISTTCCMLQRRMKTEHELLFRIFCYVISIMLKKSQVESVALMKVSVNDTLFL